MDLDRERAQRSATASQATRCGIWFSAGLEAADGDDLVQRPDFDGEGAGPCRMMA
jgi:hypothetical protein